MREELHVRDRMRYTMINYLIDLLQYFGQDKEATQQARDYFEGYAPSSPSFALIKDGKITGND